MADVFGCKRSGPGAACGAQSTRARMRRSLGPRRAARPAQLFGHAAAQRAADLDAGTAGMGRPGFSSGRP